ncbi:cobalamin biosynthesis protein [Streptomyces europaeiscabiei]|uniref:cobalamin biosynthesis protein n=1 Tax=Streptomyces europaeiscabiei TaxID=146819 RepID=UPI0038D48DF0
MADHVLGSLVVGVGASRGASVGEILRLIEDALRDAGLVRESVAALATVDTKADESGIVHAAERLGVPLVAYSAEELATVQVPNPSDAPLAAIGTPSVAEAAALASGGQLLVPKRKSEPADGRPARVTCAVASAGAVRDASLPHGSSRPTNPAVAGSGAGRHDDRRDGDRDLGGGPERHDDGGCHRSGVTTTPHHPRSTPLPHPHSASASASASASEETS